jgi:phosphoglycolate phosphatase-like HAD superfamily hydrolase
MDRAAEGTAGGSACTWAPTRKRMEEPVSIDTVVLDLDGTLVDSVYVHVTCWKSALADVGVEVSSYRIHRAIGMGGDRLVTEVAGPAVEHALGDTVRSLHARHFNERFGLVTALDGASELLENLRERGLKPVLASSGDAAMTDQLLELIQDSSALLERISGDETEQSKPAPELVEVALSSVGAEGALVVGDTVWDVEAAAKAGVPCVGLLSGGLCEADLRAAGAVAVFGTPRDLLENLDKALESAGHGTGS